MHVNLRLILPMMVLGAVIAFGPTLARDDAVARASGVPETILLDSATDMGSFGAGPFDQPPAGIYFGYGVFRTPGLDTVAVVFDENVIHPSSQTQVFSAYVAADADAATLADMIEHDPPPGTMFGVGTWFPDDDGRGLGATSDTRMRIPPGTHIEYFKLTLAPFVIEKTLDPSPFGGPPTSVYRAAKSAVIEAYGPPPAGDATCDAAVTAVDALVVLQLDAGMLASLPCAKVADVLQDGATDSRDAQLILQYVAGLLDEL